MRFTQFSSTLLLAASVQCGVIDRIEDALQGLAAPLSVADEEHHQSGLRDSATDLLNSVSEQAKGALGSVPKQAADAWHTVVREVPNGAQRLQAEMSKVLAEHAPKLPKAKNLKPPSMDGFKYLVKDEKFPHAQLRIKEPKDLGIDDVKQYTGYIDLEEEDKHFFFWFFEARHKPKDAPVILWLNGGPGCSSLTGLFFELGPSEIGPDIKPVSREYAWNNHANLIFLDQPVNTGFSYSESESVKDSVTAGEDVYAFLELFFKQFPEYTGRDFHIAGESYAGHYIPVFGAEIARHEDRSFNLTSLLIGNGLIDPLRQYDFYEPMACGGGEYAAVLDEEECQGMLDAQPRCNALIESCYEAQSAFVCVPASIYCNNKMMGPYQQTGLNMYDIREKCADTPDGLCYPQLGWMDQYLNSPEVKAAIGAEGVEKYESCNFDVNGGFLFNGDWMLPYYTNVADLLEKGIPILDYAGLADFICNALGTNNFAEQLEWSGHEEFASAPVKSWKLEDGTYAGRKRNYKHFTSLQIFEAGHMSPFDQPQALHEMVNEWISGNYALEH